ncbi:type IV pilus assembly protein [Gloeothece citriformis PCC 7424]|uniref:Type IV pilus assembly protein n=1 Tax=Gloeothece citriformis (strain PCC 7424) TaxID=65393 RepID=B7KDY7_GLOC7|nr:pilus biosynthesis protein [Gloeothece citriformis]ACK71685.1 type IV pilus assembly protein [Gloeothece citriformis PCC 7424]
MTFSEDYSTQQGASLEESGKYPVAFGITFTPKVSGIALGALGAFGAVYILMNMVMPAYTTYQEQKAEEASLLEQVEQQKTGEFEKKLQKAEAELQQKQALRKEILAFFGSEKSLDTLLLDINKFFKSRNVALLKFTPDGEATVIDDSSLGQGVNQKLKRQNINIEMEGGFVQTQAILKDLERLQPLILIQNLKTENNTQLLELKRNPLQLIPKDPTAKVSFVLQVILPVSFEDLPPPAAEKPESEKKDKAEKDPKS